MTQPSYPLGAVLRFLDDSATVDDGRIVIATGVIYDEPIEVPDGTRVIPVWIQHRLGEGIVHVHESNVLEVLGARWP